MKKLLSVLCFSFLCTLAYSQNSGTATLEIATNISCDHCLRCGSCAPRLQRAIRENDGIKMVEISPEKNIITVKYKTKKTDADKIRASIINAGFDADDEKAAPLAYEKLDACCKKPEEGAKY